MQYDFRLKNWMGIVLDFNSSFSAMKLVRMREAEFGESGISGMKIKRKRKKRKSEERCEKLRLFSMEIAFCSIRKGYHR